MPRRLSIVILLSILTTITGTCKEITLFVTGQTEGLLEQCGCVHEKGGLEARAGYLTEWRSNNIPFLLLDVGGFLPTKQTPIGQAIAEMNVKAMKQLGYNGILLSPSDLAYGKDFFTKNVSLPFLCSNVKDSPNVNKSAAIAIDDIVFGLIGIPSLQQKKQKGEWILEDPTKAIVEEAGRLKNEDHVDAIILLAHEPPPTVTKWLDTYEGPKIDLIVTIDFGIQVKQYKDIFLTNAPAKGHAIGKITLDIEKGAGLKNVSYERISLDPKIHRNITMRGFLDISYINAIEKLDLSYDGPPILQNRKEEKNELNAYVGAQTCGFCHTAQFEQWKNTRHAIAFNELLEKNRHWVPKCAACHVTGFGHPKGFTRFPEIPLLELRDVQCEVCHGPGALHVNESGSGPIRRKIDESLCMECHDQKNSPQFKDLSDLYFKKIKH